MDKILEWHLEFVRQQYGYALHAFCLYKYLKESTYWVRQWDIVAERNADIRNSHWWIFGSFIQSYYLELSIIYLGSLFMEGSHEFWITNLLDYIKSNLDEINKSIKSPIILEEITDWNNSINYYKNPIKEWRDRICHNFIEKRLNKMDKLELLNELKDIEAEFKKIEECINSILWKFEQEFDFEEYRYQVSKDYDALFDSLRKEQEIQSLFWDYSLTDESRFEKIKLLYN